MDLKQIKELMASMERTGTKRIVLKDGKFELELEHQDKSPARNTHYHGLERPEPHHEVAIHRPKVDIPTALHPPVAEEKGAKLEVEGTIISSPMVGTFYAGPSPDDPHFVKVGDQVDVNTVVCVVEAMKVMNEVKAGVEGTVAELFVEDGHPVEFSSKLFRIS